MVHQTQLKKIFMNKNLLHEISKELKRTRHLRKKNWQSLKLTLKMRTKSSRKHAKIVRKFKKSWPKCFRLVRKNCVIQVSFDAPIFAFSKSLCLEKRENNRRECQICLEEFNNDERKESVLYCGHRACFKCLTSLPNKLCPICRKEFTADQIIKFFWKLNLKNCLTFSPILSSSRINQKKKYNR